MVTGETDDESEVDPNVEFFDRMGGKHNNKRRKKIDEGNKVSLSMTPVTTSLRSAQQARSHSKLTEHELLQRRIQDAIDTAIVELDESKNRKRNRASLNRAQKRSPRVRSVDKGNSLTDLTPMQTTTKESSSASNSLVATRGRDRRNIPEK